MVSSDGVTADLPAPGSAVCLEDFLKFHDLYFGEIEVLLVPLGLAVVGLV
jgi:hypothetical protein